MKIARDIMTKNPFALKCSMDIPAAVKEMMTHHISTAPVLDSNGQLLGQVSEVELLKSYIVISKTGNSNKVLFDFKNYFSTPTTLKETDAIDKVVKAVMDSPFHRVLILDSQGHLKGIISPKDILRFLVGDEGQSGSLAEQMNILQDRITILKDQLKNTQSALTNIDGIVEKSPFMFHSVDAHAKIVIANEKLHSELGYQPKELIGKSVYDLYDAQEKIAVAASLRELMSTGKSVKVYTTYRRKNNDALRVEVVSTAIVNNKCEFVATSSISRILDSDSLLRVLHGIYDSEEE